MSIPMFNDTSSPDRHSASLIYIDPPMARRVLERNTRNRRISEMHVERLMQEMQSGRWRYNGEAIKWSVDNVLLDGQHRLTALSRLDDSISLPFLVVRGLPTETQDTMDQGRVRHAGDQLSIDGLAAGGDPKIIAGAIRVHIWWTTGRLFGDQVRNKVSNSEVIAWAKSHPVELSLLTEICQQANSRRIKARPSLVAAVLLNLYLINSDAAQEFQIHLLTGAGLEAGNPILTLRDRLQRIAETKVKEPERDIIGFFVTTWNAWRKGQTLVKLQRPQGGGWNPESFPRLSA